MSPSCHLSLLSEWCHVDIDKVRLGANPRGHRGLLAAQDCQSGSTILLIPWSHVLGMRAARHIIEVETSKGRGMDDNDFFLNLILVCQGLEQRLWSCVMASAILTGLRYPLSPWSPYISCLPHPHDNSNSSNTEQNCIEAALRRTHALTARQSAKRTAKRENGNQKLSQCVLRELRQVRADIMSAPRTNNTALEHVLMWKEEALLETHDETLIEEVTRDKEWLVDTWEQLFNTTQPSLDNDDDDDDNNNDDGNHTTNSNKNTTNSSDVDQLPPCARPIVSLQSWMWAHAIVRSRAVGLDHAPKKIMTCAYSEYVFHSRGVLLPIIDLINHSSSSSLSNAALEIRSDGVAVVATQLIKEHEEVMFDYHPNATLSLLLRNYGFVDDGSSALSSHHHQKRQILTTWNGMVQVDIAVTTSPRVGATNTTMVQVESSEYCATTGKLLFILRDGANVLPPKSFETWLALHRLAASACFLLMEQFGEPQPGSKNVTAVLYRDATYQLLHQAYLDLSAVSNVMGSADELY